MLSQTMKLNYLFVLSLMVFTCSGQLAFHTDANTNSFSVKAPGSQQSFTRYFGGQQGSLLNQQQPQPSQQQFQYAPAPQQLQQIPQNTYYIHQQQQQQPQLVVQASQQQPQYVSAQEHANFVQQQQLLQQHQLQQQAQYYAANQEQQVAASQPASIDTDQQQQVEKLLGVAYSPSTQVSHVKFSNGGGLAYNF